MSRNLPAKMKSGFMQGEVRVELECQNMSDRIQDMCQNISSNVSSNALMVVSVGTGFSGLQASIQLLLILLLRSYPLVN